MSAARGQRLLPPPPCCSLFALLLLAIIPAAIGQNDRYPQYAPTWSGTGIPNGRFSQGLATYNSWTFVGAPGDAQGMGQLHYLKPEAVSTGLAPTLDTVFSSLGSVVSANAASVFVSARKLNSDSGVVAVHQFPTTGSKGRVYFAFLTLLQGSTAFTSDQFGASLASLGSLAAVGDPLNQRVYLYACSRADCSLLKVIAPRDEVAGGKFGAALAMSDKYLAIGSPGKNGSQGIVELYTCSLFSANYLTTLTEPNGAPGNNFGATIALLGGLIFVASPQAGGGVVDIFSSACDANGCKFLGNLTDAEGKQGDGFGTSIGGLPPVILIGAPFKQVTRSQGGQQQGKVFEYNCDVSAQVCTLDSTLIDPEGAEGQHFGATLVVYPSTLVIGSPTKSVGSNSQQGQIVFFYAGATRLSSGAIIGIVFGVLGFVACCCGGLRLWIAIEKSGGLGLSFGRSSKSPAVDTTASTTPAPIGRAESLGVFASGRVDGPITNLRRVGSHDDIVGEEKPAASPDPSPAYVLGVD